MVQKRIYILLRLTVRYILPMDAVTALLDGPRARGAFLLRSVLDPPWALRIQDEAPLTLVAIVRGEAWVLADDGERVRLRAGDVAVLRGPEPYTVADKPDTAPHVIIHPGQRCEILDGEPTSATIDLGVRTWGNSHDGAVVMLTGTYQMRGEVSRRLLDALPGLLVVRGDEWDSPLVPLLAAEIVKDEPGQEAMLDRLLDLLLIAVLRVWFAGPDARACLVPRAAGPGGGQGIADDPSRSCGTMDRCLAGSRSRCLPRRAVPPVHRIGRRAADVLSRRVAVGGGRGSAP